MLTLQWPLTPCIQPNLERAAWWVFVLSNRERGRHSLRVVQRHSRLDEVAASHNADMVRRGYFDHLDPEGHGPQDRMQRLCPELIGAAGENLAFIFAEHEESLARAVVDGWMNSPGHRANLLNATHTHMGIQLFQAGRKVYATQLFAGLLAELLKPELPLQFRVAEKNLLHFRSYNDAPRSDLTLMVEVPDREAWMPTGSGMFMRGAAMLKPQWESTTDFHINFSAQYGRGPYRIYIGRASTSAYCRQGIELIVL
jgi:hypothetical protein